MASLRLEAEPHNLQLRIAANGQVLPYALTTCKYEIVHKPLCISTAPCPDPAHSFKRLYQSDRHNGHIPTNFCYVIIQFMLDYYDIWRIRSGDPVKMVF